MVLPLSDRDLSKIYNPRIVTCGECNSKSPQFAVRHTYARASNALTVVPPVTKTRPGSTRSNSSSKASARCHRPQSGIDRNTHPPRSSTPEHIIARHSFPYVSAVMFPSSDGIEPVKLHDDSVNDLRLSIPSHNSHHTESLTLTPITDTLAIHTTGTAP